VLGEEHVARDDRLLRHGGPAAQPEDAGQGALVHLRALGQARLLGMLGDDTVEGLDVFEGPAHKHRIAHADAVVTEDAHARRGIGHRTQLGKLLAAQSHGHGTDRHHIAQARLDAPAPHLLHDPRRIGDGLGVGHRVHRREPPESGRGRSGRDGFGVLTSWLAQMRVQIDEPGKQDERGRIDLEIGRDRRTWR